MWWDPAARKNLSARIDGDLVAAIARAREIEERLTNFRTASGGCRRIGHGSLIDQFVADLEKRANAETIDPKTVRRYAAALEHYRAFCDQPAIRKAFPHIGGINREVRLAFSAFLASRRVAGNGTAGANRRPMKSQSFVLATVRAMLEWAADPERGHLLPDGFGNPFLRHGEQRPLFKGDPLSEPDITTSMAIDLIHACDRYQLLLFAPMLLFGLRSAEPCFLMREYLEDDWLRVPCNPDLAFLTKSRRDKRLPLLADLCDLWNDLRDTAVGGVLYRRRAVVEGREAAPLVDRSLSVLVAEFRRRCEDGKVGSAAERRRIRDALLRDAGGLAYDHVEHEFAGLARQLGWPKAATLKDLRHLFATTLGNSSMPEAYRRYLMGQSPGRAAIVAYTHLNKLREHFSDAVRTEWPALLSAIQGQWQKLSAASRRSA